MNYIPDRIPRGSPNAPTQPEQYGRLGDIKDLPILTNPLLGTADSLQNIINTLFAILSGQTMLTADEFDALGLTAGEFDMRELTAAQFDSQGRILLV